jgi:hypothetical protein
METITILGKEEYGNLTVRALEHKYGTNERTRGRHEDSQDTLE